jgi:hypothetical protein
MTNKQLLYNKLHALRLEVDGSIVDDITATVDAVFAEHEQDVKDAFNAGKEKEGRQTLKGFNGDKGFIVFPDKYKTFEDYKNQKNK